MPNINWIKYNNTKSDTLGVFVTGSGSFDAAELDTVPYSVPGRNGDLLVSNNRYKNIEIVYPAFVPGDFKTRVQAIRNWLRGADTYVELEDSYDTSHSRLAICSARQSFEPVNRNDGANFEIVFNCKPQRFRNDRFVQITSGQTVTNPTRFKSWPKFSLLDPNSGNYVQFAYSGVTYKLQFLQNIRDQGGLVTVDCETRNVYSTYASNGVVTNYNNVVSGSWPEFPGNTTLTMTTNITGQILIDCGWWEL